MYNRVHETKTGTAQLVGKEWRDGEMPQASAGVARITVRDDMTNAVWRFTGRKRDAAEKIGELYVGSRERVASLSGSHIEIESQPTDLMRGVGDPNEDGEFVDFEFDAERHPDIVAF